MADPRFEEFEARLKKLEEAVFKKPAKTEAAAPPARKVPTGRKGK